MIALRAQHAATRAVFAMTGWGVGHISSAARTLCCDARYRYRLYKEGVDAPDSYKIYSNDASDGAQVLEETSARGTLPS